MNIYFAGSIRGGREDARIYAEIVSYLKNFGNVLTEHIGESALTESGEVGRPEDIFRRDLKMLKNSELVVAEVTVPSLGVGYELGMAESLGKDIICLFRTSSGRNLSAMIAGNPKIRIVYYDDVKTLQSKIKALRLKAV